MLRVWKFPLPISYAVECEIKMPVFSEIVSVQLQNDVPTLWAMVDTNSSEETVRTFHCVMTGETLPNIKLPYLERVFLATLQKPSGIVIHIFEIRIKQD